jgi:hypothetical protein
MVDMRVCENDCVDLGDGKREWVPVAHPQSLKPLEQTTIHQNLSAIVFDKVFGTCDGSGAAEKGDTGTHIAHDFVSRAAEKKFVILS